MEHARKPRGLGCQRSSSSPNMTHTERPSLPSEAVFNSRHRRASAAMSALWKCSNCALRVL
eukprot:5802876-Alexandrium_andersonii.AAC.1